MEEIKKIEILPEGEIPKEKLWRKRWFWGIASGLVLIFFLVLIPSVLVVNRVRAVYQKTTKLQDAAKSKDLKLISQAIEETRDSLVSLEQFLSPFSWVKFIPFVGSYEADVEHLVRAGRAGLEAAEIVIRAVEPYSDIIGLAGGQPTGGGEKTAQDRIAFVVTTVEKIGPDIEKVGEKLRTAKREVDEVNPRRYPEEWRGRKIREPLTQMISLVERIATLTSEAKPLLEVAPWFLGTESPRRYLLIFQNDGELRPTGGFMTAYAILEVNKGKIKPILSEDIYALDAKFKPEKKAPEALIKYVPLPYGKDSRWRLRDMNLSPDFSLSMQEFIPNFQKASGLGFDGVVAVDTKVLVRLLQVLGTVGVPEWGNFSSKPDNRCDGCPQVVYELERLISKPAIGARAARKAVIGPLMHSILANAMGSPKEKMPGLFEAVFSSLLEKHILFYFPGEKTQKAVESFNIAGRVKDYEGDYFFLVDSSFSGAKSNFFIRQQVEQKIEIGKSGKVLKTVTVEYKNPSPPSNCDLEKGELCLNAPYRNWFRLYVPKGARLLESTGSEVELKTYEDLGKTVFEGFFGDKYPLRPQGSAKLTFKYELPPQGSKGEYKLLIQKQPGTDGHQYFIVLGGQKEELELKTDEEIKFKI